MSQQVTDKKVGVKPEVYRRIVDTARAERRTIKGQFEYLIELGFIMFDREQAIRKGDTQLDVGYIGSAADDVEQMR